MAEEKPTEKYTEKDAAKETDSSSSKVAEAWHDAREDAAKSGDLNERNVNDSPTGAALYDKLQEADMVPEPKDDASKTK